MYSESGAEYSYFVLHVRAGECSYFFIFSCILIWSAGARFPRTTIVPSLVYVQNILLENFFSCIDHILNNEFIATRSLVSLKLGSSSEHI